MHGNVPVLFGRGRLDSLGNKGLAAYLIARTERELVAAKRTSSHHALSRLPPLGPFHQRSLPGRDLSINSA
jgi:hypothetical protein